MAAYFNALLVRKRLFKRTLKEVKMIPRDGWSSAWRLDEIIEMTSFIFMQL